MPPYILESLSLPLPATLSVCSPAVGKAYLLFKWWSSSSDSTHFCLFWLILGTLSFLPKMDIQRWCMFVLYTCTLPTACTLGKNMLCLTSVGLTSRIKPLVCVFWMFSTYFNSLLLVLYVSVIACLFCGCVLLTDLQVCYWDKDGHSQQVRMYSTTIIGRHMHCIIVGPTLLFLITTYMYMYICLYCDYQLDMVGEFVR